MIIIIIIIIIIVVFVPEWSFYICCIFR